jgi:hypothetical protein
VLSARAFLCRLIFFAANVKGLSIEKQKGAYMANKETIKSALSPDDLVNTGKEGTDSIELDEKELGDVSGGSPHIKGEGQQ